MKRRSPFLGVIVVFILCSLQPCRGQSNFVKNGQSATGYSLGLTVDQAYSTIDLSLGFAFRGRGDLNVLLETMSGRGDDNFLLGAASSIYLARMLSNNPKYNFALDFVWAGHVGGAATGNVVTIGARLLRDFVLNDETENTLQPFVGGAWSRRSDSELNYCPDCKRSQILGVFGGISLFGTTDSRRVWAFTITAGANRDTGSAGASFGYYFPD